MAREGLPFVAAGALLALVCWVAERWLPGLVHGAWLFVVATGFMAFFFRDPRRQPPQESGAVVSAADGRVVSIHRLERDAYVNGPATRISVFLSVLNVHVNRIPFAGEVDFVDRRAGRYRVAFADEASEQNEQSVIGIRSGRHRLVVKQIVGILARRIACYLQPGQHVEVGQRFGLIRFGSRVDLILPDSAQIRVTVGDRVRAGETVMGVLL